MDSPITWIAIYLTIWWTVLFAILPLGVTNYHQAGIKPPPGCDPGAPINPNLKKKFITTSWVAALVTAAVWLIITYRLIPLPPIPQ